MSEKNGSKSGMQAGGVLCIAGAVALGLWARSHSPHMGFMEMANKMDSYILQENVYNVMIIIAALLGLMGIINLVKSFIPSKGE